MRVSGNGGIVRGSKVVDNGQIGISGTSEGNSGWEYAGVGLLVEFTEIARNGVWSGISPSWEGGGTKWVNTTDLTVRRNWAHSNYYTALWTDINNLNTLYVENLVENNDHTGIFHEISYDAVIRHNVVVNNGHRTQSSWAPSAGIRVANSQRVRVLDNVVRDNWNHITLSSQARTRSTIRFEPLDEYLLRDVLVRGNRVRMPDRGLHGAVGDDGKPVHDPAWRIRFRENTYIAGDVPNYRWGGGSSKRFADWQRDGQDVSVTEFDPFTGEVVSYAAGTRKNL
jgi:hypothetical protein